MAEASPPWAMKRKASGLPDGAPMMKAQAKVATQAPMSKAPISKMPPTAPIAKRPAPTGPPPATGQSFAKRPPPSVPGKAPGAETKAAPPSAPVSQSSPSPPPSRGASWQDFVESDPLYAMIGELGERKVVNSEGEIDEEILTGYIERLTQPGVVKPKDWIEVWAAMNIPVTVPVHSRVVQMIIEIGVMSEVGDTIGEVLAELVKGHRAKVKAVEDAITTIFECGCDEKACLVRFLLCIFPKSPTTEWGWSRIGWSWKEWWQIANKIFSALEPSGAFEALRALLAAIETDSGTYLPHQQIWDEKRLALVRASLCKFGGLKEDELAAAVEISLS